MSWFVRSKIVLSLVFLFMLGNNIFAIYGKFYNKNQNIIADNIQESAKRNFEIVKNAIVAYEMSEDASENTNEEHCDIGKNCFLKNLARGLMGNLRLTKFESLLVPYEEIYGNFFKKIIYKLFGLNDFYNRFSFVFDNIRYTVFYKKAEYLCYRYDSSVSHTESCKIVTIYGHKNSTELFCDGEYAQCLFKGIVENGKLNFCYKLQP